MGPFLIESQDFPNNDKLSDNKNSELLSISNSNLIESEIEKVLINLLSIKNSFPLNNNFSNH